MTNDNITRNGYIEDKAFFIEINACCLSHDDVAALWKMR
jgi:hypothetical protein